MQGNSRKHATWLASRPRRFEKNAVRALIAALRATSGNATKPGFSLHIVHLAGTPLARWCQGPDAHGFAAAEASRCQGPDAHGFAAAEASREQPAR